ncbi:hypothetical protein ANCDUO_11686, partial [Ancylostoma duodenale]
STVSAQADESSQAESAESKGAATGTPRNGDSPDDRRGSQPSSSSTSLTRVDPRPSTTNRPVTASTIAMTVNPARPTIGKFVRSPQARPLTPPDDVSMDGDGDEPTASTPAPGKNNKVAPE